MQDKLKPLGCPHCPKSITEAVCSDISNRWQIYCGTCGSSSGSYRTEEEAIVGWNRRAADKTIAQLVEALEKARLYIRGSNPFEKNTIEKIDAALAAVKEKEPC